MAVAHLITSSRAVTATNSTHYPWKTKYIVFTDTILNFYTKHAFYSSAYVTRVSVYFALEPSFTIYIYTYIKLLLKTLCKNLLSLNIKVVAFRISDRLWERQKTPNGHDLNLKRGPIKSITSIKLIQLIICNFNISWVNRVWHG